jgi:hypothetical protein
MYLNGSYFIGERLEKASTVIVNEESIRGGLLSLGAHSLRIQPSSGYLALGTGATSTPSQAMADRTWFEVRMYKVKLGMRLYNS